MSTPDAVSPANAAIGRLSIAKGEYRFGPGAVRLPDGPTSGAQFFPLVRHLRPIASVMRMEVVRVIAISQIRRQRERHLRPCMAQTGKNRFPAIDRFPCTLVPGEKRSGR